MTRSSQLSMRTSLLLALLPVLGCRDSSVAGGDTAATSTTDVSADSRGVTGRPTPGSSTMRASTTAGDDDPDAGPGVGPGPSPDGVGSNDNSDRGCEFGTLGIPGGEYDFNNDTLCDLERLDRVGVPHVGTLLIASIDEYNRSTPAEDQFLGFAVEINAAIVALHNAFDDDLATLGLMPCSFGDCAAVVTPLVIPDTLVVDLDAAPGFPNGRSPSDPVLDRMLAAILLDAQAHPITTLSDMPLSPADNDVPFDTAFPYLAPPHA